MGGKKVQWKLKMDDTQKILLKRHLNKNGEAQVKFTKEVAKECNNYIPYDTGRLKDMMVEIQTTKIIYNAPYARQQFYNNKGLGKQGLNKGGVRGKRWDKRCWIDKGDSIVKSIAQFVGGRSK
ncbi:minor capsid protein [Romboutsia sp. 1001713B170207_170306_H8]|uniref:minor capsid protein n=1 Tax=Romboutsia sp. 1001713B170207_170306_H8 TaxID=2787112 RepID=UPI0018974AA2|nr:minor capsid protein [Romboutsia sp. 1001713B170207_170306_H8]